MYAYQVTDKEQFLTRPFNELWDYLASGFILIITDLTNETKKVSYKSISLTIVD